MMNSIQTACYALIASAFVLAAILMIGLQSNTQPNAAQADGQVITQPAFTMMTARTRGNGDQAEESLFVLDNTTGTLVVYMPNVARSQLVPVTAIKMADIFGGGGGNN